MYYSIFEVFSVGIGPSSSHTVGPMKAAKRYVDNLAKKHKLDNRPDSKLNFPGQVERYAKTTNACCFGLQALRNILASEESEATVASLDAEGAPERRSAVDSSVHEHPSTGSDRAIDPEKQFRIRSMVARVETTLYGSLALTGVGHGTVNAVIYGLLGLEAENMNLDRDYIGQVKESRTLLLGKEKEIDFDIGRDIVFSYTFLPEHSNGMKFAAYDKDNNLLLEETYFSVGGGTIARQDEVANRVEREPYNVPYQFNSYKELAEFCKRDNLSVSEIVLKNEEAIHPGEDIKKKILHIYDIMREAISKGVTAEGVLPGGLNLRRRAPESYKLLKRNFEESAVDALAVVDWINTWAFAVAEENAAGGRIVTAPTMGAAGVIPSVIRYYKRFCMKQSPFNVEDGLVVFLTTASAICSLYRTNASISGAEVGCQGEVGVACSMAAGGLAAALGGSTKIIANAAEIGMEHNLGLTCDPIKGLVQVPCIERNAVAAVKAVNAARLAMRGAGEGLVSLDSIIKTMYETGLNLKNEYKETSQAGLAVNVPC